ncbi:PAS domain-containing protein [Pseudomonas argentinensis]|uniref:histidine kinase n=1 Tax=Phytopseudomonas argentinensis TaxID=289370 RepID=A0A1I3KEG6_9GAMM|nr:PAS domain-containing protein [Pseudomonas argentinensis]KAB0550649.1 PAS domain-containing protein [Pseudomonas argentinensis]SFI70730.1 PAS domain S-box-containing protein [Pseudomonas argentinensis]
MDHLTQPAPENAFTERLGFLANGAKMGQLLQRLDSSNSPLGAPADWSPSLKTLMSTVLPVKAQIVLFWGPQYVALYNDAYAPSIGNKHPRALGRPAVENWAELWDDLEPLLRGVRETGETFAAKDRPFYIERHGHGEAVYFDVSYSAVREADGSIGGVLCVVNETTQRVQFERRQAFLLELSQALPSISEPHLVEALVLQRLTEELNASQVFFAEDLNAEAAFGIHPKERTQASPEHPLQRYSAAQNKALLTGRALVQESAVGSPAALHVPVVRHGMLEAVLVIEHSGKHVFSDYEVHLAEETAKLAWAWITHARAEVALRLSSTQLSAMFDQAGAGIAVCDAGMSLVRVNDHYCEIVGRSRNELLGRSLYERAEADESALATLACEYSLRHGRPFETTRCYSRPDGSKVWVQHHVSPLLDEQHKVAGTICVCVDISERVRAEAELRELNECLEDRVATMVAQREAALAQLHEAHKMEMVGQLTGGIAHDFNNLLTPIMASLELIRRRLPDDRCIKLTDGALQAADRARILVGRLLTFARRQTLKPQPVALCTLIRNMRDLIQRSVGPMIELRIDIAERMPTVFIDPHQLELAVLNLAVNARDAMGESGRLSISAELHEVLSEHTAGLGSGQYTCLMISDSGCGMDEETLRRCAEPFYSTKGVGKGTGLGLSMVQGLLMQSGGGFAIDSTPGQGTRVRLWLPTTDAPVACEKPERDEEEVPRAARPTHILLVDDETLVRDTTSLQLHDLGYQVTEVDSAAAAMKLIDEGLRPDALVTDHIMENMTGAQLAQELRQRLPALPVLIITGYANLTPSQISSFEVLAKPFRRRDLADRLAQLLSKSETTGSS